MFDFRQKIYLLTKLHEPKAPIVKYFYHAIDIKSTRSRFLVLSLLIFSFAFLTIECGFDVEDPTPPDPPVWVKKSLPEEWPERGIDAHESGGIYLEWEPNPEESITSYLIFGARYYQGNDSLGDYAIVGIINLEENVRNNFLHSDAATQIKYYYKLKAEDSAQNLSVFSDSIAYTLLRSIDHGTMSPNGNADTLNASRYLSWKYTYDIEMENYILTILTQNDSLVVRAMLSPTDYSNGIESWCIPEVVVLNSNKIYKWRIDVGAQYGNNYEASGSESSWATFFYHKN